MSIAEEPFGTSSFVLLFKVTVLNLYVTIIKPKNNNKADNFSSQTIRFRLNDNAIFYKTFIQKKLQRDKCLFA